MAALDNLGSLHKFEEEVRVKSLAAIEADAALSEHWTLVAEAMNVIYAFAHDHRPVSDNELTLASDSLMPPAHRPNFHCRATTRRRSIMYET